MKNTSLSETKRHHQAVECVSSGSRDVHVPEHGPRLHIVGLNSLNHTGLLSERRKPAPSDAGISQGTDGTCPGPPLLLGGGSGQREAGGCSGCCVGRCIHFHKRGGQRSEACGGSRGQSRPSSGVAGFLGVSGLCQHRNLRRPHCKAFSESPRPCQDTGHRIRAHSSSVSPQQA